MNMNYAAPMNQGFQGKPNYPPPQASYGPPPPAFGQGSEGGGVLPPSMSGPFQGEMPMVPPANNFGGYNNPPVNNFGGYNNPPPMASPMSNGGGYNMAPSVAASQPPAQPRPIDTRMGGAGGRPDGPAFTGAGNPAYANVTPVAGQQFSNINPNGGSLNTGMNPGSMTGSAYNSGPRPMNPPPMNPQSMGAAPMGGALSEANAIYQLELSGEKLARKDLFSKSDPYVQIIAPSGDIIYKSETIMNNQNPRWKPFNVPLARLGGSINQPFTIEVYDWDKNSKDDFIGRTVTTMRDLQQHGTSIALTTSGIHLQNPGRLAVHRCSRIN